MTISSASTHHAELTAQLEGVHVRMGPDRRCGGVVLAAGVVAAALAACSPQGQEERMTPEESRDRMVELVEQSTAVLDLTGWAPMSQPRAVSCELPGGGEGVSFSYMLATKPGDEPLEDAQKLAEHWKGLGMDVRLVESPAVAVFAEGGSTMRMSFAPEPGDYGIGGSSTCVAGSVDDFRGGDLR